MTPGGQFECPAGSYHRVQKPQKPDAKVRFSWPNWPFGLIWQPQYTNWGVLGYWWAPWVPQWPKIHSTKPIFASYPPKKLIFGGGYGGRYAGFGPLGVTGGYRLQRDVQYTYFWYTSTRKVPKIRFEAKKVKIGLFGPFWNVRIDICVGAVVFRHSYCSPEASFALQKPIFGYVIRLRQADPTSQ